MLKASRSIIAVLGLVAALHFNSAPQAAADEIRCADKGELTIFGESVAGLARKECTDLPRSDEPGGSSSNQTGRRGPAPLTPEQVAAQRYQASLSGWRTSTENWQRCMGSTIAQEETGSRFDSEGTQIVCGNAPTPPEPPPGFTNFSPDAQAGAPRPSPEQLAFAAAARLRLPDPQIGMGPEPSINRWGKAFVGVEYWFWAKGESALPPVSETVGPASVRLSAKVEKVTVRAGEDADVLTCVGAGSAWTEGTSLETPSPTCGRRFTTVGERRLIMTATWAVSWEINGATGVIRLDRSTARAVDVSELHSVTR